MSQQLAELQRLIDRAAIQDVLARYFQGIDAADKDQVRTCFTDDIRAAYDGRGSAENIEELMNTFHAFKNKASGAWKATSHFMGNLSFMLLRDDVAETETYAIAFLSTTHPSGDRIVMRSLRYLDRLRKTKDGWRISERIHTLDWSCEVPATFAAEMSARIKSTLPPRG